jgi:hypothetical protein
MTEGFERVWISCQSILEVEPMRKPIKFLSYLMLLILAYLIPASGLIAQADYVNPSEAHKYVGMKKTVCGIVASATYAGRARDNPLS